MTEEEFRDHYMTTELICPYCSKEVSNPDEYFSSLEEDTEIQCGHCDKDFFVSRQVTVYYTTSKMRNDS